MEAGAQKSSTTSLRVFTALTASPNSKRKKRANTARYRQPTPTNPQAPSAPWGQSADATGASPAQSLVGKALMTSGEEVFL